jgi:hypothetical protein
MMHSSTCDADPGTLSSTLLIAYDPSTGLGTLESPPKKRPIGVRLAPRMTGMFAALVMFARLLKKYTQ